MAHINLAACLEDIRNVRAVQLFRNVSNRSHIGRDILASRTITARGSQNQFTSFVTQRDGEPVNLGFSRKGRIVSLALFEIAPDPLYEIAHVIVIERIAQRQHGNGMRYLRKLFRRRRTHTRTRTVWSNEIRETGLKLVIALPQRVIFCVRDFGVVLPVIALVMFGNFNGQAFKFGLSLLSCQRIDSDICLFILHGTQACPANN